MELFLGINYKIISLLLHIICSLRKFFFFDSINSMNCLQHKSLPSNTYMMSLDISLYTYQCLFLLQSHYVSNINMLGTESLMIEGRICISIKITSTCLFTIIYVICNKYTFPLVQCIS